MICLYNNRVELQRRKVQMSPSSASSAIGHIPPLNGDRLRALPKVSLHEHLDGCVRIGTLIELSAGLNAPLPARDPEELRSWIVERSHSGSLLEYLKSFSM